ncbi:MAG: hypothetical protein SVK08_04105 [Halobacteriota archaeon]|nr:hypothetical protein [Halobacteriota archaeon]
MQLLCQSAKVRNKGQLLAAIKMAENYPGDTKIDLVTKEGTVQIVIYDSANVHGRTHEKKIAQIRRRVREIPAKQLF